MSTPIDCPPPPLPGGGTLCLLAPGQLSRLLRFLEQVPGDPGMSAGALVDAWRAAGEVWAGLQRDEAWRPDHAEVLPLPDAAQAHLEALVATPAVQRTFDTVPVAFGLVPLAQLLVSQYTMAGATVESLRQQAPAEDLGALLQLCLPLQGGDAAPAVRLVHKGSRELVFVSDTHDMRLLEARAFEGDALPALPVRGHAAAMAGLFVGISANLVNVLLHRDRLVINNGHHRLHSLLAAGCSHVPALIQVCASREEFDEVAPRAISEQYSAVFESPRPPLLTDYAHPALTLMLSTPPMQRELRLRYEWDSRMVAR